MSELSPADVVEASRLGRPEDFRPISSRVAMVRGEVLEITSAFCGSVVTFRHHR
jgi:hypothetical protein